MKPLQVDGYRLDLLGHYLLVERVHVDDLLKFVALPLGPQHVEL